MNSEVSLKVLPSTTHVPTNAIAMILTEFLVKYGIILTI